MRNIYVLLLIGLFTFGLTMDEAFAKRFGGGRSFGVQRSQSALFPQRQTTSKPALNPASNTSRWGGVLGGLLIGGLLTSLFMGHGFGTGILTWLILGALVFFLISWWRRRMHPGLQGASASSFSPSWMNAASTANFTTNQYQSSGSASAYPPGFSPEQFLRDAKVKFIRLQAAYDQKNLQDLTAFTAPEVFGEIKMQLDERGDEPNVTEVMNLEAELLDVSRQVDSTIASVRFTGMVKENNEPFTALDEIWHFRLFDNSKEWVVGGIQQDIFNPD